MKYLIKDTTKEERILLVEKALSISMSGADAPSKEVLDLVNEYINGNKELKEIQKEVLNYYKNGDKNEWSLCRQ